MDEAVGAQDEVVVADTSGFDRDAFLIAVHSKTVTTERPHVMLVDDGGYAQWVHKYVILQQGCSLRQHH